MKRVLMLGNSHLAALKQGAMELDDALASANISIDFFGTPRNSLSRYSIADSQLCCPPALCELSIKIHGKSKIDLTGYDDVFVILGSSTINTSGSHILDPALYLSKGNSPASRSMIRAIYCHVIENLWFKNLLQSLSKFFTSPHQIKLLGPPIPAISINSQAAHYGQNSHRKDCYQYLLELAELPQANFIVIPQYAETLDPLTIHTYERYSRGSVRLDGELKNVHPSNDKTHMNAEYGCSTINHYLLKPSFVF